MQLGERRGGKRSGCCMIKGSANCVTDRRRRMALDGVTCILISFESWGEWGVEGVDGSFWEEVPVLIPSPNVIRSLVCGEANHKGSVKRKLGFFYCFVFFLHLNSRSVNRRWFSPQVVFQEGCGQFQ